MFNRLAQELLGYIFVVLIVVGILTAQGVAVGFGVMGLLVTGIAWLWSRVSLEEVSYERELPQRRVFIGEEVSMTVFLTNRKPVPLGSVDVADQVPDEIEVSGAEMEAGGPRSHLLRHSTSMAWYERIRWDYRLTGLQRGLHRLGPATLGSGDLFGFFKSYKTVSDDDYLLVYPRVVPLPELGLPAGRPLGDVGGGLRIFSDPTRPSGIREYQVGDPLNTVDWKASARMQRLQVRTFEPSSTITVIPTVVVETGDRHWEGYSATNLERVITTAASVASFAAEQQYSLGLFSNGAPILADRPFKIAPSRSPEQLTIILEALATIQPMAMSQMAPQLAEHSRQFPMGATLVVVTAYTPPTLADVIGTLKGHGYRMVVLYVGDGSCPPLPEGVLVHELQDYFARLELAGEFGPR